jgi:TRAP-type C4-dicarboxylate transport system permease small subunit
MNHKEPEAECEQPDSSSSKKSPIRKSIGIIDKSLLKIEEEILSWGIIALAALVIGGVVSRTVFNQSWIFMEEVANTIMIIITFLGLGYCVRKARHIRMSAIHDMLPKRIRKVLIIIVCTGTGGMMLVMGYWAMLYTTQVYTAGNVTPALRIPVFFIVMWVPIGFFMAAIEYFMTILKNLRSTEVYLSIEVPDVYEDENQIST